MDIDPTLIFILIVLLAPLIERLFKGSKQQPPPPPRPRPRQPPQQRIPRERPRPQLRRPEPAGEPQGREPSAADMVPDDLWAILTGEQRPRSPAPPPQQRDEEQRSATEASRPGPERRPAVLKRPAPAGYDMRGELPPDEEAGFRRPPPPERAPVEDYVREVPRHDFPEVVSLEELVIDDVKRHTDFHQRIAALPPADAVQRAGRHPLAVRFRASDELRRAIIMSEVLGRPKGMD